MLHASFPHLRGQVLSGMVAVEFIDTCFLNESNGCNVP